MNFKKIISLLLMTIFFGIFLTGCTKKEALDPGKASVHAEKYIKTLYVGQDVKGPVCMPEAVSNGYTQCSFSYREISTTETDVNSESSEASETSVATTTKVGTILCNNNGCIEGDTPTMMSSNMAPSGGHDSITDDWLFWYMLYNSGSTTHYYNGWHSSTPSYGRTSYYSSTSKPTSQSKSYYSKSYSPSVKSSSAKKYSTKTSSYKSTSGYGSSKRTSGTSNLTSGNTSKSNSSKSTSSNSTSSSTTKKSTSTKSSSTKKSTRSSGYGSSRRSSGYKRRR